MINDASSNRLLVPALLYGPKMGEARSAWKKIAKKLAKTGSWDAALEGVEFIPIELVKGDISRHNSHPLMFRGDNLWLDSVGEILVQKCHEASNDSDTLIGNLYMTGLDSFWFSLTFCVTSIWMSQRYPMDKTRLVAATCLRKLLNWWPTLCKYDQRFSGGQVFEERVGSKMARGWPRWCSGLAMCCIDLGMELRSDNKEFFVSPHQAAELARQFLNKIDAENAGPSS